MRNIKMTIAYVGTRYAGWQVQPARPTIQGALETGLSRMLNEEVRIAGAGRTDSGVHAVGQVANFSTGRALPLDGLRRGLNACLPEDIRLVRAEEAVDGFHARSDARWKEYRFRMTRAEVVSPFDAPFVAPVRGALDVGAMGDAAALFAGSHDFTSFCPASCTLENRTRTVTLARLDEQGDEVVYTVRATGFLRHMIRTMVGTLVQVGQGLRPAADIARILEARDRRTAGPCAEARGLTLIKVAYEEAEA